MAGRDVDVVAGAAVKGRLKKSHVRHRWTKAMKEEFLDHLAATCNVGASARVIGVPRSTAHGLRRRDAIFASDWVTAIEAGYQLLETHLIGIALATSGAVVVQERVEAGATGIESGNERNDGPGAVAVEHGAIGAPNAADFEPGFRMLRHRAAARAGARRGAPPFKISSREDTDAEILKKLALLAARRLSA